MCKPLEVLDHSTHGYLAYCPDCGGFTLAFGTTLAVMLEDDIRRMGEHVSTQLKAHRNAVCPNAKAFMFKPGTNSTCQMVLTYTEMEHLETMLNRGMLLYEAQSLLHDATG